MQRVNPIVSDVRPTAAPAEGAEDAVASCFLFAILGGFAPIVCTGHMSLLAAVGAAIGVVVGLILAYK